MFLPILALSGLTLLLGSAEVPRFMSVEHIMGSFVDPPLAGFLLANAVPAPFKFDAVIFALAVRLVWSISMPHRKSALRGKVWPEIVEGWTWVRALPAILRLAVMLGLIHALSMMPMTILVPCSQDLLGLSAIGYGTLLRVGAAGGVRGSFLGPPFLARVGAQNSIFLALTMTAVPSLIIALASNPYVMGFALLSVMITAQL